VTHEQRSRILEAAEDVAASSWLEAAEALLAQQESQPRTDLLGSYLDRGEARRHIRAIAKIRAALQAEPNLKRKVPYLRSDDPLVRRMRRAELLCPKGWREGIRKKLVELADAAERKYLESDGVPNDDDIVLSLEVRAFVSELDWIATRGESAHREFSRRSLKVMSHG